MVYREHALHAPERLDDDPDRALATLEVSGTQGRDGRAGPDGRHGSGGGGDGGRGGNAGPAQIGQTAGNIAVRLAPHPSSPETRVEVRANVVTADRLEKTGEQTLRFDEGGFLDLLACGGRGGGGGHGGAGGAGGRGSRGHNATRSRRGGDGGPGGDGGDGGDGSSGAAGGAGGKIDVHVSADDTHLLMLIRRDLSGGAGGQPGVNGRGGAAGPGGSGGSSHHWTTTSSYTDSKGRRKTRTHHHHNPGGRSGPSGRAGRGSGARLHAGAAGPDGEYTILVEGQGGVRRYHDRYRLQLVAFEHVTANRDNVYEPGERVEVKDVVVKNVGGMPTPPNHDIRLALESEGWVWPDRDAHLVLPHAVDAKRTTSVPGTLFFEIGAHEPEGPSDPLSELDYILHTAWMPSAHREFDGYQAEADPLGRFHIRYPVQASVIESLYGLAPGEAARVRFAIRSVSERDFGAASELGRTVRFRLFSHHSELGPEHFTLLDAADTPMPFDGGWVQELPTLAAEQTTVLEATIVIGPGAPHYRSATLRLGLELGPPSDPEAPRPIQFREFTVRVARRYRRVEGCDLLLVTNHRTTREQLEAWERLAARRELKMAVWDVSLEGHLDLRADLGDGRLVDHIAGGTVALLNPSIDTAHGSLRAHHLLDRDALHALREAEVSIAVLGGEQLDMTRWLMPDDASESTAHRESPAAFRAGLEGLADLHGQGELEVHETLDVHHIGFFFEPPEESILDRRARALAEHLAAEYPNRRFFVTKRFAPEEVRSIGLAKRWKLGTLEVRTTLESGGSHVVHVAGKLGEARPVDLDGPYGEQVVLIACDFDRKLDRLQRALDAGRDAWPEVRAILIDLAAEQEAIRRTGWRRGLSGADMKRALPLLRALSARSLSAPDPDSPEAVPLLELAARLRLYASSQVRWWEHALAPLRRSPRLAWVTQREVDRWLERTFGLASTEEDDHEAESKSRIEEAEAKVDLRVRAHRGQLFERAEADRVIDRAEYARLLMREPLEWEGVTTDAELLGTVVDRILDESEREALRERDQTADALRNRVRAAQVEARARLLRAVRVDSAAEAVEEVEVSRRAAPREAEA